MASIAAFDAAPKQPVALEIVKCLSAQYAFYIRYRVEDILQCRVQTARH